MIGGSLIFLVGAGFAATLALTIADESGVFVVMKPWHRWLRWLWYPSVFAVSAGVIWFFVLDVTYSPALRTIFLLSWVAGTLGLRFPRHAQPGRHSRLPVVVQALLLGLLVGSSLEFAAAAGTPRAREALMLALAQAFAFYQDIARWAYDRWFRRSEAPTTAPPRLG